VGHAIALDDLRRLSSMIGADKGPVAKNGRPEPNTAASHRLGAGLETPR
jgi:hypothetical protein